MGDEHQSRPERDYQLWDESDYLLLADGLRAGLDETQLASRLGRTLKAIRSRIRKLVKTSDLTPPAQTKQQPAQVLAAALAADADFDLLALARTFHAERDMPLWTLADDTLLHQAWDDRSPSVTDLARAFGLREYAVVKRLMYLDLATSTIDVADRLGGDPDGVTMKRARIAADTRDVALWVLAVTSRTGDPVQISIHVSKAQAEEALEALKPDPADEIDHRNVWWWVIACGVVGEDGPREQISGSFKPPAKP